MAKKEIMNVASESDLAILKDSFPTEPANSRISLPRLGFYSQDQTSGKGKAMTVTAEAGEFYTEAPTDEVNEEGKKIWEKTPIGKSFEAKILYKRYQLSHYDSSSEAFTSSPVYDSPDEIIPLFRSKEEVDRGTPAELKAKKEYQGVTAKGKPTSKLEDCRILYVKYKDLVYQMVLRGTSKFSYLSYEKKTLPPSVITKFGSEPKESGSISWNCMTFIPVRLLNQAEATEVVGQVQEIKQTIQAEKAQYVQSADSKKADAEFEKF